MSTRVEPGIHSRPPALRALVWLVDATRITPNALTVAGFLGVVAAGALIVAQSWWAAGFLFIASALVDSLDGTLARWQGSSSTFGAFLDSTLDRAADGVILGAFAMVFAQQGNMAMVGVVVAALIATFSISYARARAEGLGLAAGSSGLMERTERLVLIGPAIFMGGLTGIPETVIAILAILSTVTAIDRIASVRRALAD